MRKPGYNHSSCDTTVVELCSLINLCYPLLYTLYLAVSQRFIVFCFYISAFMFFIPFSQYSELLIASYNANEHAPQEPDGVVLVWNMKFKKTTPEYVFHCQVRVFDCCSYCLRHTLGSIVLIELVSKQCPGVTVNCLSSVLRL